MTALTGHYTDRDSVLVAAEIHLAATRDPAIAGLSHRHRAALDSAIADTYACQGEPVTWARRHARITAALLDRAALDRVPASANDFTTQMTDVLTTLLLGDNAVGDSDSLRVMGEQKVGGGESGHCVSSS